LQFINGIPDSETSKGHLKDDLPHLERRAALLNGAIFYSVVSAVLTALIIIVAFVSALFGLAHEYGVAILFVTTLIMFFMSQIAFARKIKLALNDFKLRV
jgi:hypothetical protein